MHRTSATVAALLLALLPRPAAAQGAAAGDASREPSREARFPVVRGTNLEGRDFTLPRDLEGERNVVIVAFEREQQRDVDTWLPALGDLARTTPGLRVYELPTIATPYRLMRPIIDGGMRRGIPDRAVREATITLYLDTDDFRRALAIPDARDIHVLLVDRAGRILWRTAGRYDAAAMERLAAASTAIAR